jgi:hypothetical protein
MPVGVVDVKSAAPVVAIEFSAALVQGIGAVLQIRSPQATEDRIEGVVVDGKRDVMWADLQHVAVIDGDIPDADDREIPGGTSRAFTTNLEIKEVSQELRGTLRIVRRQQEMLDTDAHAARLASWGINVEHPWSATSAAREAMVPLVLAGAGAALLPAPLAYEARRRGAAIPRPLAAF